MAKRRWLAGGLALAVAMGVSDAAAQLSPEQRAACAAGQVTALELYALADRGEAGGDYAQAAAMFWELGGAATGGAATCPFADEHLYHAAVGFQRARDVERALAAYRALLERHPDSRLAPKALEHLALLQQLSFDFAGALASYEALAQRYPKEDGAIDALSNTVLLRLVFGDWAGADAAAATFQKNYGTKRRTETARVAVAVAESAVELAGREGGPGRAQRDRALERARTASQGGSNDALLVQALVLGARQAARDGKRDDARRFARGVVQLASGQAATLMTDAQDLRGLGRVLTGLGEAHLLLATIDSAVPPPRAPPDARGLAEWVPARLAEIERFQDALKPVLEIQPVPPPKWVVEAHGEVAVAWTTLHDALVLRSEALREKKPADAAAFRDAAASIAPRARAAADAYVTMGAKMQHGSSHLTSIEAWRAAVFPDRYVALEEMIPAPGWVAEGTVDAGVRWTPRAEEH